MNNNTSGSALGVTAQSYTPPTGTAGTTYYYVVITNTINDNGDGGAKTASVTSNIATVTVNAPDTVIDDFDLSSLVDAPEKGDTPDTTAIDATQYTGTVTWYEADGTTPHTGAFGAAAVYVAKVNLTAKSGYTFAGVGVNSFTYTGASAVTNAADSGEVIITFPATENGTGTAGDPILISTAAELQAINSGLDKHYKLAADINAGNAWIPIGSGSGSSSTDEINRFTGTFDGNGHTVIISGVTSNLATDYLSYYRIGLFGVVGTSGTIKNLMVEGVISHTEAVYRKYVGGIAGQNRGTIENCISTVDITATNAATDSFGGGIVGTNFGTIRNCYANGSITSQYAGGIAGENWNNPDGKIEYCVALNPSVQNTAVQSGRISYGDGSIFIGNYARSDMGINKSPLDKGLTTVDGEDVADNTYNTQDFWQTEMGWDFTSANPIWKWDSLNNLPKLAWE